MSTSSPLPLKRLTLAIRRLGAEAEGRAVTGLTHDEADEVVGSVATDSAVSFDPLPLLAEFDSQGAEVIVMGQVAGILHGSTELTGDLDLLWDGDSGQAARLAKAFAAIGCVLTAEDGRQIECDADALRLPKVYFASPTASGDCCTPFLNWGDLDVRRIIDRADSVISDEGFTVRYVSAPDLIAMRRAVGRPKDLRRAIELEQLMSGGATP